MKNSMIVTAVLLGAGATLSTAAADRYIPCSLSGFNADQVMAPGETPATGIWSFYTEEVNMRGALPASIKGMFSDIPYNFADFREDCALLLSSATSADGELFLEAPVKGKTLWVLCASPDGPARIKTVVRYIDGRSDAPCEITAGNYLSDTYEGTALWQLGLADAPAATAGTDTRYALYEAGIPVSDPSAGIASVSFELVENGKSASVFAITASDGAVKSMPARKLFFMSDSHLDTQWNWTVKQTIDEYLRNTLTQNFERFEDPASPNFVFNFEGAIKYMWAKEYYPELFARLKTYVKDGKWHIAGGSVDANDVNIGSAEAQMRNYLYGQTFYRKEFGVRGGRDVMLPDCFGFPWSLPTIAAHCGMKYFHTNKLAWNSAYAYNRLPRYTRWKGPDGAEILAVLKTNPYDDHEVFRKDMSADRSMLDEATSNLTDYGIPAAVKYVGPRSDRGGGLDKETADWISKSVDGKGALSVSLGSTTEMFDQIFHMGYDKLPVIDHGLPMRAHGVGAYTSRCMLKYWMRKGELLGTAAEKASVAAAWIGALPYQHTTLTDAWVRLLWHQFHDDIPGTSIEAAYKYTVNDQVLNQLDFSRTLNNAVGAVAANMNTGWAANVPVVVYNPLSIGRCDVVEATMRVPGFKEAVSVRNHNGEEVPSQVLEHDGENVRMIFLATVPALGYASFDVAPADKGYTSDKTLSASAGGMENGHYKVTFDSNGDICSIIDKTLGDKEMLSGPIRLAMLFDESTSWPSWEIHGDQLRRAPREYVDKEGLSVEVAENGPLRASLKITRSKNGSTFVQYVRMVSEGSEGRIDFVNEVNWQSRERMLKATFPLTASNPKATYDLSIGVDVNGNSMEYSTDHNNTDAICEFLGHRWADVTDRSGSFGVSVLNDCKYGWDKQTDNELRLTLIHTPKVGGNYSYQGNQDLGLNRFTYSFFAHAGTWGAGTQWEADRLNEPMAVYAADKHQGPLGAEFGYLKVNNDNVAVKAVKKAEMSDLTVVRLFEITGHRQEDVELEFPSAIISAEELNGVEEHVGDVAFSGNRLTFSIGAFQPKTFAVKLAGASFAAAGQKPCMPVSQAVSLDYNMDAMSYDNDVRDADTGKAFPAELVGDEIVADGITFRTGSRADGEDNAVSCTGQTLTLPAMDGARKIYLLASSLNPEGSDVVFRVGGKEMPLHVEYYAGNAGVWGNSAEEKKEYRRENTAFTATHSHNVKTGTHGVYEYLYMYKYTLPVEVGTKTFELPNDADVLVYAVTLSDNVNDDARPVSEIVSVLEHTDTEDTYKGDVQADRAIVPDDVLASGYTNLREGPLNAADDDEETKWCDAGSPQKWIEYRFGREMTVTGWRVRNAGCENSGWISGEYTLQRYVNGGWVDVDGVRNNSDDVTNRLVEAPFVTTAVRLHVIAGEGNERGRTARIYDFKVYGHEVNEGDAEVSQIISRRPAYGYGKQVAKISESTGRVKAGEDPVFILDSDPTTKWCYNGAVSQPQVVVELSDVYLVDRFDIHDSRTMEHEANSDSYKIAVSLDGKSYTPVADRRGVASEDVHSVRLDIPVAARFVRLQMGKGGGNAVRVYGFDIWGRFKEKRPADGDCPLSIDKTVTGACSISDFSKSPFNLFDGKSGNNEFVWSFKSDAASTPFNWVVVDLEERCSIDEFVIRDSGGKDGFGKVKSYNLYVSDMEPTAQDMAGYHKAAGGENWQCVAAVASDASDVKSFVPASPVSGRYVKLEIPSNAFSGTAGLQEFEVYGQPGAGGLDVAETEGNIYVYPTSVLRGEPVGISVPRDGRYVVSNTGGMTVASGTVEGTGELSTSGFSAGVYVLRIYTGSDGSVCRKIVVR